MRIAFKNMLKFDVKYNLTKCEHYVFWAILSKAEEMDKEEKDSFKAKGVEMPQSQIQSISGVSISSVRNSVSTLQKKKVIKLKKNKVPGGNKVNVYFITPAVCRMLDI